MNYSENQLAFEFTTALESYSRNVRYSRARLCDLLGQIEIIGGNSKSKRVVKDMILACDAEIEKYLKRHFGFGNGD
jgi:hypothetical protein